jgi:hypothetical protein
MPETVAVNLACVEGDTLKLCYKPNIFTFITYGHKSIYRVGLYFKLI